MPSLDHNHTYVRYKERSGKTIKDFTFRCDHPECTRVAKAALVIGKKAACTSCGAEYILDREAARRVNPRCLNCANTKEAQLSKMAGAALEKLFGGFEQPEDYSDFLIPEKYKDFGDAE